jgi:hypothetical protein
MLGEVGYRWVIRASGVRAALASSPLFSPKPGDQSPAFLASSSSTRQGFGRVRADVRQIDVH